LLPLFTQKTGIAVKVLAQGTGQALDTGPNHEALLLRSHSQCCCFLFPAPTKQT
jgi:tungstate transport system substrate-binding protein